MKDVKFAQPSGKSGAWHSIYSLFFALCSLLFVLCVNVYAADNPLDKMRDNTTAFFKPLNGRIITVEDKKVTVNIGAKDSVKPGMRFNILREEAPFKHPVTKQPLGNLESLIGQVEIKETGNDSASGNIIRGVAKEGDKIRISEVKVNLLFCQSKDMNWQLSDSYYRKLKETERFNIIDTNLESDDPSKVLEEARRMKADVALHLLSKQGAAGNALLQRLYYVSDGLQFSETETIVNADLAKELRFGEEFFKINKKEASLQLDLPVNAKLMVTGDMDGDGKKEIALSTGKDVLFYNLGADLQPALGGLGVKGSRLDEHLWLDTLDMNKNGRDEIIITSMKRDEVNSYIYELKDSEFILLYQDKGFLRKLDKGLIGQAYSRSEGFDGAVFAISWDGAYKKDAAIKLPKGVNIYDFVYLDDPQNGRLIVSYDGDGYLNVYDGNNARIWKSKTKTGGFLTTFSKSSPSTVTDRGEWSIKDRLFLKDNRVLSVERKPLLKMVKGLGFGSSRIKSLSWNGLSMDENVLIDNISGPVFDYDAAGDSVIIVSEPLFGIKAGNIMKGENPIKMGLYIYSLKRM
jgi:hypothetical protein